MTYQTNPKPIYTHIEALNMENLTTKFIAAVKNRRAD
uniref:Uncharacterized protein n=1 Tax=Arundo donax TaxID=35708 RepID=A0A0A9C9Z5_ARUDO